MNAFDTSFQTIASGTDINWAGTSNVSCTNISISGSTITLAANHSYLVIAKTVMVNNSTSGFFSTALTFNGNTVTNTIIDTRFSTDNVRQEVVLPYIFTTTASSTVTLRNITGSSVEFVWSGVSVVQLI